MPKIRRFALPCLFIVFALAAAAEEPCLQSPPLAGKTLSVAIVVDRNGVEVLATTVRDRPYFERPSAEALESLFPGEAAYLDVEMVGTDPAYSRSVRIPGLCLEHGPEERPHIEGDRIRLHRETIVVELPDLVSCKSIRMFARPWGPDGAKILDLGNIDLTPSLRMGAAEKGGAGLLGTILWPEDFGDTDIYKVEGSEPEAGQRINVVVVPDGYTYAEKATMNAHFQDMVTHFRGMTPFIEHDDFLNYILVYAYSSQSGTDQCDCDIVVNTAMNTRFQEVVATCGHSDNRCLYYGSGAYTCDADTSTANIVAAEMRAPALDTTVVMVNTSRYGGCGGYRAVYSAGVGGASDIAVHELGHSLADLADEYGGNNSCGTSASGINTSLNATQGAWPEWIGDIGSPWEGAQYYNQCVYRPVNICEMRSLNQDFCPVCRQQWALTIFSHSNVNPTAPISGRQPNSPVATQMGIPVDFEVYTRLASGPSVVNNYTWTHTAPGKSAPVVVFAGSPTYQHTFNEPGTHQIKCELVADANFVKPPKTGANRDTITWIVQVAASDCSLTCSAQASPAAGVAPLEVKFSSTVTPIDCMGDVEIEWNFGDGTTSTQPGPTHSYPNIGSYPWTMTATADGVQCTQSGTVWVYELNCSLTCTAQAAPASGQAPLEVSFAATASPTYCDGEVAYSWTFGDGGTSGEQSPTHTYLAGGSYTWTLTATVEGVRCTKSGKVTVADPCTLTCSAQAAPASGALPLLVDFSASAVPSNCSGPATYAWTFGDGNGSASQNPAHTYTTVGIFGWTMTATVDGVQCVQQGTVTVSEPCALTCTAQADPALGTLPLQVNFSAAAAPTNCAGQPTFAWVFGDGNTSGAQNLTHTYGTSGVYNWSMTASVDGLQCVQFGTVTVNDPCAVTCTAQADPAGGTAPLAVSFAASATPTNCAGPVTYTWDFGDGTISNIQNPVSIFTSPGTYTWTLTVAVDGLICTQTGTVTVVSGLPGDCDGNGEVTIGEVQRAVNMFLEEEPPGCGVDCDGDGTVTIGELQKVINAFLGKSVSC